MGAYSSWAMLALTHHLIVRVCALRCGLPQFSGYAVLGDDIVIADDNVAAEYVSIMRALGVGISMHKTLVSNRFCEFAKKLRGKDIDISPIGAGLILQAIRYRGYGYVLTLELCRRRVVENIPILWQMFKRAPRFLRVHWTTFLSVHALYSRDGLRSLVTSYSE